MWYRCRKAIRIKKLGKYFCSEEHAQQRAVRRMGDVVKEGRSYIGGGSR